MLINGTLDITDEKEKLYIEKYNNYINGDESLMDNQDPKYQPNQDLNLIEIPSIGF